MDTNTNKNECLPKEVWQYDPTGQRITGSPIGSVGEMDIFLWEQVIRLVLDRRSQENLERGCQNIHQ